MHEIFVLSHPFDVTTARDNTKRANAEMRKYDEARAEYEAASMSTNSRGASTKRIRMLKKKLKKPKKPPNPGKNKRHKETVDIELCAVTLETIGHIARRLSQFHSHIGSGAQKRKRHS